MLHVYVILAALGLLLAAAGAGEWHGHERGQASVQGKWDQAERDRKDKADAAAKSDRDAGYEIAAEYEAQKHELEQRHAKLSLELRRALQRPAPCPASGTVGDVLLPADIVRGMFNRAAPASGDPAGAPAGESGTALRRGASTP